MRKQTFAIEFGKPPPLTPRSASDHIQATVTGDLWSRFAWLEAAYSSAPVVHPSVPISAASFVV